MDAIREGIKELERAGYIVRSRTRNDQGQLKGSEYVIYEQPQPQEQRCSPDEPILDNPTQGCDNSKSSVPVSDIPTQDTPVLEKPILENPTLDNPTQAFPTLDNPTQLNTYRSNPNPKNKNLFIPQGANPYPSNPYPSSNQQGTYAPYQVAQLRQETKDRIGYEVLANAVNRERLDEIVELIVETLCSEKPVINIAGEEYPAELVKERLMQLDSTHIEYIFSCIKNRSHEIRNIKRYLLATLFNAPATISHYYDTQVRRDFGMC